MGNCPGFGSDGFNELIDWLADHVREVREELAQQNWGSVSGAVYCIDRWVQSWKRLPNIVTEIGPLKRGKTVRMGGGELFTAVKSSKKSKKTRLANQTDIHHTR